MNIHLGAHFPFVPIVAAAVGLALLVITTKAPFPELGKAMLWGGTFAALFASSGGC